MHKSIFDNQRFIFLKIFDAVALGSPHKTVKNSKIFRTFAVGWVHSALT